MNDGLITQPREDEKFPEVTLFLFAKVSLQAVQPGESQYTIESGGFNFN